MPDAPKILIIEDDEFLSSLLLARLEKEGYITKRVFDGAQALQFLKEFKPNLIILDIIMPNLSGWEFLDSLSVDMALKDVPVVVLTQLGQEEDVQRAKSLGVKEYFIKARTSIDELVRAVKKYLPAPGGGALPQVSAPESGEMESPGAAPKAPPQ